MLSSIKKTLYVYSVKINKLLIKYQILRIFLVRYFSLLILKFYFDICPFRTVTESIVTKTGLFKTETEPAVAVFNFRNRRYMFPVPVPVPFPVHQKTEPNRP